MNISFLITGGKGQLAKQFRAIESKYPEYSFKFVDRNELDITNKEEVIRFFEDNHSFTHIINCAAYTQVDNAEVEFQQAKAINGDGVKNLIDAAKIHKLKIIHFSTDYVFDGTSNIPLTEDMETNPIGQYGASKLVGEELLVNSSIAYVILRTSWVYSNFGHNFYKTISKLGEEKEELNVIFDQVGTPTYALDLAEASLQIAPKINNDTNGIYNFSNEGVCSWYDFAQEIIHLNNLKCKINPVESKFYKTVAKRPSYSVLNKKKIREIFNLDIPYWKTSLVHCTENAR